MSEISTGDLDPTKPPTGKFLPVRIGNTKKTYHIINLDGEFYSMPGLRYITGYTIGT